MLRAVCLLLICLAAPALGLVHHFQHAVSIIDAISHLQHTTLPLAIDFVVPDGVPQLPSLDSLSSAVTSALPDLSTLTVPEVDVDATVEATSKALNRAGEALGSQLAEKGDILSKNTAANVDGLTKGVGVITDDFSKNVPKIQEYFSNAPDAVSKGLDQKLIEFNSNAAKARPLQFNAFPELSREAIKKTAYKGTIALPSTDSITDSFSRATNDALAKFSSGKPIIIDTTQFLKNVDDATVAAQNFKVENLNLDLPVIEIPKELLPGTPGK